MSGAAIPQRSNVLLTTSFALPNFEGKLRAARIYKPVADPTKPTGYKFTQDGTKLWVASVPAAASRNIFTVTQSGTMTALTVANVATLAPFMNVSVAEATRIITYVRSQPLDRSSARRRRSWIRRRSILRRTRSTPASWSTTKIAAR